MNTSWTFTTTNNICIDAWQVSRWYLLHSINPRINYRYFIIDYAVACGGRFKALFLTTFLLMLLHLCSIVEGSLLHVACCARPRLTASFCCLFNSSCNTTRIYRSTRIYLLSLCSQTNTYGEFYAFRPTASPRKVAWDLVKSVVAVLMIVLLLWGLKWLLQRVSHLTPLPPLLRVCSRVARFIYWRLLNHFFLP